MIKAIIFDLDNCLSAADESSRLLLEPVFDAVRQSNQGTLSECDLQQAFEECWRDAFDVVATPWILACDARGGLERCRARRESRRRSKAIRISAHFAHCR
jgi:hypothetical protein